jgi:hypothetical protein
MDAMTSRFGRRHQAHDQDAASHRGEMGDSSSIELGTMIEEISQRHCEQTLTRLMQINDLQSVRVHSPLQRL